MTETLLAADEPPPVTVHNPSGRSPFLLVADHAGRAFPKALGQLGLADAETFRHIAWDIGILGTSLDLAARLDAPLIAQTWSRLVIDCNRPPGAPSSIPVVSELTPIPGNAGLSAAARAAREREIFRPYHDRIAAELDARAAAGRPAILVAMHSFTPVYRGERRPWHAGLLYRHTALAHPLLKLLQREPGLVVGDNEPYSVSDETDYAVPVHGERRGLLHVAIEIRQDLITEPAGQAEWADRFARLLPLAAGIG
ncbi:MAG: N-formylglutamate amidohydrolase [Bauldia sp.]|nr:N-formylglutamate amidohydrolase [Bauldia sp.]